MIKNIPATLLTAAMLSTTILQAQTPAQLHITHKLGNRPFAFNETVQNNLGNDFKIERVTYYLSGISIWHDGGTKTTVPATHYILADAAQNVISDLGSFNITKVDSVSFFLGVDQANNHTDPSQRPAGHPLALQSPSMHWGWSSGYIFIAMEGKCGASMSKSFNVHALEDMLYTQVTVPVSGVMRNGKIVIALDADYSKGLQDMDVTNGVMAHGSGNDEVQLMSNYAKHVFKAGSPVSVSDEVTKTNNGFKVYPNPSAQGMVNIVFDNHKSAGVTITDITGRTVLQHTKPANESSVQVNIDQGGLYLVQVRYADGGTSIQKLTVY